MGDDVTILWWSKFVLLSLILLYVLFIFVAHPFPFYFLPVLFC